MKPIVLKVATPDAIKVVAEEITNPPYGPRGKRNRITKKQKTFNMTKHKQQLKRKQQQHARAK